MRKEEKKKINFVYSLQSKEEDYYSIGSMLTDNYYITSTLNF